MTVLSGFFGTFVFGASVGSFSGLGSMLFPVAAIAFALPLGGTIPLTIFAASI